MASSKLAWPHDIASPRVAGLAILGLYSLVTAIRRLKRASSPGQEVPYAAGWVPILGHLLVVRKYFKENQKILMGRWGMEVQQEQNLDIFRAEMMGLEMVIVNDPDLAEEVCNGDPHRFTKDFRSIPAGDVIKKVFGNGLFFANTDDPKWQTAHNILKTPFSTKGMKAMMPMMCNQADLLVAALKRHVGYGNATYIDSWVTKMAFETVAVCGLGTPLGCFESEETHPYVAALNGVLEQRALFFCPRVLQPLLLPGRLAQLNADCDYMRQTCIDIIRQRREQGDPGDDHRRDLLDMMLYDKDKKTGLGMTEDMIVDNVLTFLFAGQDSTAAAMASCLCFLCAYPEKKAKLLKEIDEVVGDGQPFDSSPPRPVVSSALKEG
ncbi:unnamed protein product [Effrenium voratum]|nr:unnamed protein product [Effrenium voratum]CAJ1434465.1 unnamed protein product [Effrenium voratum]